MVSWIRYAVPLLSLPLATTGCGNANPGDLGEVGEAISGCKKNQYPCAPFGTTVGSVVADLEFDGKGDSNQNGLVDADDLVRHFSFSEFFNRKDRDDQPKVLAIVTVAQWCVPCQLEAARELGPLAEYYRAAGTSVELIAALLQDGAANPATEKTLDQWATRYRPNYDLVIDPTATLSAYGAEFPSHLVIRTTDMTLTHADSGGGVADLATAIDAELAD